MKTETFHDLMEEFFPGRSKDIIYAEYEKLGIDDLDRATESQRYKLVNDIIAKHGKFSAQRNRLVYNSLMESLDLKPKINHFAIDITLL